MLSESYPNDPQGPERQPDLFPELRAPEKYARKWSSDRTRPGESRPSRPKPARRSEELPLFDAVPTDKAVESVEKRPTPFPESVPAEPPKAPDTLAAQVPPITETYVSTGEIAKAREILEAVRVLKRIEVEGRGADPEERATLARFGGFGAVALNLFPDPVTGTFKSPSWQTLGQELVTLLTPDEYASAKRTVFNAFYTSPTVIRAMFEAFDRLGVPRNARVLEPGCGSGNFLRFAPETMRFVGVELDSLSGRIAQALFPQHEIRIESFRDTRIPEGSVDAVIGNPPFADLKFEHNGERFSLHDYFFAKSLDALKPGGVLALVTSHFTLDKRNGSVREYFAARADFLGAIRLPSDAFKHEGTKVVTDIVFLRRRNGAEPPGHVDPAWLEVGALTLEGAELTLNRYFLEHPEMVLGEWSRKNRLYGGEESYSVIGVGNLEERLREAIRKLPELGTSVSVSTPEETVRPFVPPPLEKHISEGSFFVAEDHTIHQIVEGRPEPVNYGGSLLKSDGTMTGRRLAQLIKIRDEARRVLQSQNEGWPEKYKDEARKELNRAYDVFVEQYGLINKTTFSESAKGTVIQRMPNVAKFIEDPDAMLVMALEECDPTTGTAVKAAIMTKDVVGPAKGIESVASAEEGLLVSLDKKGVVDLPFIASLYGKDESRIVEELEDLIYLDPSTRTWQTADEYLSGNVREKLKIAQAAGDEFARNVQALQAVQPEDVLPGEIDANLGAPWIPEEDVRAFAAQLFGVPPGSIGIAHLKKDALWSVEAGYDAQSGVPATTDYGTARANGVSLFELALNLKTPVIYDVVSSGDREERIVNQEETLAAREKQKRIKEAFRSWVFSDPERTEKLVRIYNDTYNILRLRSFDGAHLEFPGMNTTVRLHPHQKDAIWRGMSSGNTLLAHVVGAGKTFTMCAIGMKRRQAGLTRKPLYVVPNHMLEQFAREFQQLYPNAKLLAATKDDLARDRRKILTAKIASSEWDGIVITHSSFERIGMSKEYQARFLRAQIAEYDELLIETAKQSNRAHRNIVKTIEKQKAKREERLKELLAEDKKDDGLVFDELGVDHVFVDEAHYFKNLETPTKMERVAGIQTGGSERAFDLYMKARYLGEKHPGHGVTFATGTPISNTMVEMYTMQRFLDPQGLAERGIEHFDAWAATFGEVVDTMEIAPDGASLRPRSRFAKFVNLPELQQMFRSFADVQTAAMLNLPRPSLKGDKPEVVACPMSEAQKEIQDRLVERYERIRSQKVDPREDNALAITTDGRKLALDGRLVSPEIGASTESKIDALVERIVAVWRDTEETKGTQLVFCDLGVNPTAWCFSVYEELISKLIGHGIPQTQIAAMGDATSDARKQALFERVRQGSVRVLIGSTQKMGTGANVQRRLVALHHLDAPWKPAEVEQREGRILRQGNQNKEVAIYRYVTSGSFDAYMWQALETKARFIAQIMTGECGFRKAEDIGGQELSFAEVKAIASGNPAVLTLAEADAELRKLLTLRKQHADEQFLARRNVRELPQTIASLKERLAATETDRQTTRSYAQEPATIRGARIPADKFVSALGAFLESLPKEVSETRRFPIGTIRGLSFGIVKFRFSPPDVYLEGEGTRKTALSADAQGPRAVSNALERLIAGFDSRCEELRRDIALAETKLRDFEARIGTSFPHVGYIDELTALHDELKAAMSSTGTERPEGQELRSPGEIAEAIKDLMQGRSVEAATIVQRSSSMANRERPATARARERLANRLPEPIEPSLAEPEPFQTLPEVTDPPVQPPKTEPIVVQKRPEPPVEEDPWRRRGKKYQKWLF